MEYILMLMELNMKEIGKKMFKMDMEKKLGKMIANMKDFTKLE
jgi:hypothetical protein